MRSTTVSFLVAAVLLAGCGGSEATHKTNYPLKDDPKQAPAPKAKPPTARTLQDLIGGQLVRIEVAGGGADEAELRKVIRSKPGDAFNVRRVGIDMRALWATGRVDDVTVNGTLVARGKVALTYAVKPRRRVRAVVFRGNKSISTEALRALGRIKQDEALSMVRVFAERDRIGEHYVENGFLLATVKASSRAVADNRADVVFEITERARIQISEIKLTGVSRATSNALLPLLREKNGANAVGGAYVASKLRRAILRVTDYYLNRGYLNASIREPKVSFLSKNKRGLTIEIRIKEGRRYRMGKVTIKGKLLAPTRAYLGRLNLRRGQIFSRSKVVDAMQRLVAFHKSKGGAAKPNVAPISKINDRAGTIDLTFEIR